MGGSADFVSSNNGGGKTAWEDFLKNDQTNQKNMTRNTCRHNLKYISTGVHHNY